jgi:nucleoside-diphosphate-sugar epimerase
MRRTRAVVCGAGGFIGGHLVSALRGHGGFEVRAVDSKPLGQWHQRFSDVDNRVLDLRDADGCRKALRDIDVVYNLAANTGGRGFVAANQALAMLSATVNTQLLEVARESGVQRFFFASSASAGDATAELDGAALEKRFSERMCLYFSEDFALATRVARLHNVYGPWGRYEGGRESAPAAICRKVAEAVMTGRRELAIWGDGEQTRSFTYINDCIDGIEKIVASQVASPIDLGSSETATINQLVDIVEAIAEVKLKRSYDRSAPTGASDRRCDNQTVREALDWEPSVSLQDGLEETYRWIFDEISRSRYANAA